MWCLFLEEDVEPFLPLDAEVVYKMSESDLMHYIRKIPYLLEPDKTAAKVTVKREAIFGKFLKDTLSIVFTLHEDYGIC